MDYSDTTVILPVKNEPATGSVARDLLKNLPNCKLIVVYTGSRSDLKLNFTHRGMRVMKQTGTGKGVACVQAVRGVTTDIVCFIDGDSTYETKDLRKLIELVRGGADLALGNRLHRVDRESMPFYIELGNKVITKTANLLYGMSLHDSQTGLRAIRTSVFRELGLREKHFGIESEMNIKAQKKRYKIVEAPIKYYKRLGGSKQMKPVGGVRLLLLNFKFLFGS